MSAANDVLKEQQEESAETVPTKVEANNVPALSFEVVISYSGEQKLIGYLEGMTYKQLRRGVKRVFPSLKKKKFSVVFRVTSTFECDIVNDYHLAAASQLVV
jgi:hypothetical protein